MVERVKHTSPLGELSWVYITGNGKRNYNDDGDIFSATITLAGDAVTEEKARIDAFYEEHQIKGATKEADGYYHPYVLDKDGEKIPLKDAKDKVIPKMFEQNEDLLCIVYKTGITWPDGKPKVITTYNAAGEKVSLGQTRIGNGSTGCLAGQMSMFDRGGGKEDGVTHYLNAVQVATLVAFEGGDNFDKHEGGFVGVDEESGIPVEEKTEEETTKKAKPKL